MQSQFGEIFLIIRNVIIVIFENDVISTDCALHIFTGDKTIFAELSVNAQYIVLLNNAQIERNSPKFPTISGGNKFCSNQRILIGACYINVIRDFHFRLLILVISKRWVDESFYIAITVTNPLLFNGTEKKMSSLRIENYNYCTQLLS